MKAEKYLELLNAIANKSVTFYGGYEKVLYHLLKKDIESVRYGIEQGDVEYFHKSFRQIDITDSGYTDMAIWTLLGESKWALWLLDFMRKWDKDREITEHDVFSAMLDFEEA